MEAVFFFFLRKRMRAAISLIEERVTRNSKTRKAKVQRKAAEAARRKATILAL
jgi:hypothetical protein